MFGYERCCWSRISDLRIYFLSFFRAEETQNAVTSLWGKQRNVTQLTLPKKPNIISGNFPRGSIVHTKKKSEPLKFPRGGGETLLTLQNLQRE